MKITNGVCVVYYNKQLLRWATVLAIVDMGQKVGDAAKKVIFYNEIFTELTGKELKHDNKGYHSDKAVLRCKTCIHFSKATTALIKQHTN